MGSGVSGPSPVEMAGFVFGPSTLPLPSHPSEISLLTMFPSGKGNLGWEDTNGFGCWPEETLGLSGSFLHIAEDDYHQEGSGVHAKWATSFLLPDALLRQPLDPGNGGGQQAFSDHYARA